MEEVSIAYCTGSMYQLRHLLLRARKHAANLSMRASGSDSQEATAGPPNPIIGDSGAEVAGHGWHDPVADHFNSPHYDLRVDTAAPSTCHFQNASPTKEAAPQFDVANVCQICKENSINTLPDSGKGNIDVVVSQSNPASATEEVFVDDGDLVDGPVGENKDALVAVIPMSKDSSGDLPDARRDDADRSTRHVNYFGPCFVCHKHGHRMESCPLVAHLPRRYLWEFVAWCRQGCEEKMKMIIESWWPCPHCHSVAHSLDKCPDFHMAELLDYGRAAIFCYQRGEPDEADIIATVINMEKCGICKQTSHRIFNCPDLQAARPKDRREMREAWDLMQPFRLLTIINNLYCGYCDSYTHGCEGCATMAEDLPKGLFLEVQKLYSQRLNDRAFRILQIYEQASAECIVCHETSHRVGQCPNLENLPHKWKRNLEMAERDLDARKIMDILDEHTCRLCGKADHKIDDCEQLSALPSHIAEALMQAVWRHCIGYAKKRLAALKECSSKSAPPLVAAMFS
eukprot:jgi/Botrbrau1/4806/Bobra.0325s0028.2